MILRQLRFSCKAGFLQSKLKPFIRPAAQAETRIVECNPKAFGSTTRLEGFRAKISPASCRRPGGSLPPRGTELANQFRLAVRHYFGEHDSSINSSAVGPSVNAGTTAKSARRSPMSAFLPRLYI